MRIAICVKQVPGVADIEIDRVTKRLRREGVKGVLNPHDGYAMEVALRLKEQLGASITAITMGPPQARAVLKLCLALGADAAYLLNDMDFAGSDTYSTAYILAAAIRRIESESGPFDLVLCGRRSSDGDTAQVGAELAEQLDIAQITAVCEMPEVQGDHITALVDRDRYKAYIEAQLPALLTIGQTSDDLRYATIGGIIAANRSDKLKCFTHADLPEILQEKIGLDGSPTRTAETYVPERKATVTMIEGFDSREKVVTLIEYLKNSNIM